MPTYTFICTKKKCAQRFDAYKKSMNGPATGELDTEVACEHCGNQGGVKVIPDQLDIQINIGEFTDRYEKKAKDHHKKVKDPERARKLRKQKFGTEGISITKSPHYKKDKRIKAKGNSEVDKKTFIQQAARNPNAVAAAQNALQRAGKKG